MGKIFSLASLRPEREPFEGNTGTFSFILDQDTSVMTEALRYRLGDELDRLSDLRANDPEHKRSEKTATEWLDYLQQLAATYIFGVTEEERKSWSQHECFTVIQYWREQVNPILAIAEMELTTLSPQI